MSHLLDVKENAAKLNSNADEAVLELMFNPESQGIPFDTVAQSVQNNPLKEISPEVLEKLQGLERDAVALAEKDDLEGALKLLNQCIDTESDYASAYNNRAQIFRLQKETDKALADLDKVVQLGVGQPKVLRQAYTQRAIIKRQQGDEKGAREDFELGAKFGNPLARNFTVNENPYAKLCNAMMAEVMARETMGGLPSSSSDSCSK
ncbi:tetratricopeptide repeat protein 36-like protein [Gongronella butleri]|nr:tetratricopeptide repeat protein 36-like protein [Gongronella butleri]